MKMITFASLKGGAGKTTALMTACSSLVSKGLKVGLLEADENAPLHQWRKYALKKGTWNESCEIEDAVDLQAFEAAYERLEARDVDIVLTDTQGGGSEFNLTILASSDMIVIPTALTRLDLDSALDTYALVAEMLATSDTPDMPVGILVTQIPTGRLTAAQSFCLETIQGLPSFDCKLPARNAFADLKSVGMLHLYEVALSKIPSKRIAATHISKALKDADTFANDLMQVLGDEHAHS